MTPASAAADPARVLRLALIAWGAGHLALGRTRAGWALLLAEVASIGLVAWLFIGLGDSSLYLVPFLAGIGFLVAWAWQAVDAYGAARRRSAASGAEPPPRSPATPIAWLCLPLLVWGGGFWLVGARAASPAAVLDRFVADWTRDELEAWPADVAEEARAAAASLGDGQDRFRDVRIRIAEADGHRARAVAEAIHFERRESTFLGLLPASELVPVADREVMALELRAVPIELPGGGDAGAVRWELVDADAR